MQPYIQTTTSYSVANTIKNKGYIPLKRVINSLQGAIWKCKKGNKKYVIKIVKKKLHKKSMAINSSGRKIQVKENIIKETNILRYLTAHNPPSSLVKYETFFSDKYNYYLIMEDAGSDFFDFIVKCHKLVHKGSLQLCEWHKFCKNVMKQICDLLEWMHDTMHCCHFDLSLENFTISNVNILTADDGIVTISDDFQVKLIDFGLAEIFDRNVGFYSKKYCGKRAYQAPKVYNGKYTFDARKADIWSLAVCFFMMIIGIQPYTIPKINDHQFKLIITGKISKLLNSKGFKRMHYVDSGIIDLMKKLFTMEEFRLSAKQIKQHSWLL